MLKLKHEDKIFAIILIAVCLLITATVLILSNTNTRRVTCGSKDNPCKFPAQKVSPIQEIYKEKRIKIRRQAPFPDFIKEC